MRGVTVGTGEGENMFCSWGGWGVSGGVADHWGEMGPVEGSTGMAIEEMLTVRVVNGEEGGSLPISFAVVELRRDEGGWKAGPPDTVADLGRLALTGTALSLASAPGRRGARELKMDDKLAYTREFLWRSSLARRQSTSAAPAARNRCSQSIEEYASAIRMAGSSDPTAIGLPRSLSLLSLDAELPVPLSPKDESLSCSC